MQGVTRHVLADSLAARMLIARRRDDRMSDSPHVAFESFTSVRACGEYVRSTQADPVCRKSSRPIQLLVGSTIKSE